MAGLADPEWSVLDQDAIKLTVIAAEQSNLASAPVDCFVAAAKPQFILSDAEGGVEGLLATVSLQLVCR
jgi:hypothetical protein